MRRLFVLVAACVALVATAVPAAANNGTREVEQTVQRCVFVETYGPDFGWSLELSTCDVRSSHGADGYGGYYYLDAGSGLCSEAFYEPGALPVGASFHWSQKRASLTYPTECGLLEVVWTANEKWANDSTKGNVWYENTYGGVLEHRVHNRTVYLATVEVFVDGQPLEIEGNGWVEISRRAYVTIYKPL